MSCVVVLGAAGIVGRWAVRYLPGDTDQVVAVDRVGHVDYEADVRTPSPQVEAAVADARLVVLALPEDVAASCLEWLPTVAPPEAVVVSTCSVQRPLFEQATKTGMRQLLVGVVPMFSPTLPAAGRSVVVVARQDCDEISAVRDRLSSADMSVTVMSPDAFDTAMSYLQVLPHAAVLSFIGALAQAPVSVDTLMAVAPPPVRTLVALACRMLTAPHEIYWHIQHANPDAPSRRGELTASLERLDSLIGAGHLPDFCAELSAAAVWLGSYLPVGADDCRAVFCHLQDRP